MPETNAAELSVSQVTLNHIMPSSSPWALVIDGHGVDEFLWLALQHHCRTHRSATNQRLVTYSDEPLELPLNVRALVVTEMARVVVVKLRTLRTKSDR
jgi:hypothetical protein